MTIQAVLDAEADVRWRDWLARGAASDRRRSKRMTGVMLLIAIGLAIWVTVMVVVR